MKRRKSICMSSSKVRGLLAGSKTKELVPVTKNWVKREGAPFQAGDVIFIKEQFYVEDGQPIYMADADQVERFSHRWYAATQMPVDLARIRLRITELARKRMGDLTEQDAVCCGYQAGVFGKHRANTPLEAMQLDFRFGQPSTFRKGKDAAVWLLSFRLEDTALPAGR